ncbi:MAG: uroporphyrinogen decarboxylase [Acidobacteria bacterium RIFCSPLOWO2_02_FULL_61_28]|nr:MAG: uroporphyrinogen decarboxylase [Acidobacteria bacterium RIFCSPLOWO2_02_FULL_61_28]
MNSADGCDLFLRACRREPVPRTPVWFMRQAGRYMQEYRELRARHSLLELCRTPELAAAITLQPLKKLGVDAAIIFADLLLPAQAMGMKLEFAEGEGPVLSPPIRAAEDVRKLGAVQDGELSYVAEAIRIVCRELNGSLPVIGFCGAPFTVASYMIEGSGSRNFVHTKRMMYQSPELWQALMQKLVPVLGAYLRSQAEAGAGAVQIFDSWVGCLNPEDYRTYVLPYSRELIRAVAPAGVPIIHFGTGTATLLELMREAGGDVIGVDWRIALGEAWRRVGYDVAVQGNLDPVVLFGPREMIRARVEQILRSVAGRPGHIFNLGHGILPETPVENVQAVVEIVRQFRPETP